MRIAPCDTHQFTRHKTPSHWRSRRSQQRTMRKAFKTPFNPIKGPFFSTTRSRVHTRTRDHVDRIVDKTLCWHHETVRMAPHTRHRLGQNTAIHFPSYRTRRVGQRLQTLDIRAHMCSCRTSAAAAAAATKYRRQNVVVFSYTQATLYVQSRPFCFVRSRTAMTTTTAMSTMTMPMTRSPPPPEMRNEMYAQHPEIVLFSVRRRRRTIRRLLLADNAMWLCRNAVAADDTTLPPTEPFCRKAEDRRTLRRRQRPGAYAHSTYTHMIVYTGDDDNVNAPLACPETHYG